MKYIGIVIGIMIVSGVGQASPYLCSTLLSDKSDTEKLYSHEGQQVDIENTVITLERSSKFAIEVSRSRGRMEVSLVQNEAFGAEHRVVTVVTTSAEAPFLQLIHQPNDDSVYALVSCVRK